MIVKSAVGHDGKGFRSGAIGVTEKNHHLRVGPVTKEPQVRIGKVIGKVTLGRCHTNVCGATWVVAAPLYAGALVNKGDSADAQGEPLVVFDEWGAGSGSLIAISEGAEAAAPFAPHHKPIDAYNTAILDHITINRKL